MMLFCTTKNKKGIKIISHNFQIITLRSHTKNHDGGTLMGGIGGDRPVPTSTQKQL